MSRTLVSVSVSSARPNIAGRATAISFFARGARTGRLHRPDARHLELERMRRRQQLSAERPGRLGITEQAAPAVPVPSSPSVISALATAPCAAEL